ncbi:MAG: hypothetical protein ACYST6_03590 [Planctomycetota bacterium]|jgi:hypothetical protein
MPIRHVIFFGGALLIIVGCGPKIEEPVRVCSGKSNVLYSLSAMRSQSENAVGLKARGRCRFEFNQKGKLRRQNLTVRVWMNPPDEIYVQGDASVVPKAVILGSNAEEFWMAVRPKEVSTYWWGRWSEQGSVGKVKVDPRVVLEAFGAVEAGYGQDWSLLVEGPFDVLTMRGKGGRVVKKVYVYNCDYRVSKVEYYDEAGQVTVEAELRNYRKVSEGFWVPRVIRISDLSGGKKRDSIRIRLSSVKGRRQPRGFKHELRIIDGEPVAPRR